MLTLLSECHFWTAREEIRVKSSDYGVFRYARSRDLPVELAAHAKRDYTERRNGTAVLKNSRRTGQGRLKDNIKRLEELLRTQQVVCTRWRDATQLLLLFANGLIVHACVDVDTGDILRMVFEKYLVGKLAAEHITDAFFTRSHIVLAYSTNQLTVVHLQRPNVRPQGPQKIATMEPRIFHVIIPGPLERKLARHLSVNSSFDLFVIWTKSSQNEVYPWRPTIRDQDRANIHVFKLKGMQLESISYCWTENDPLCVDFLRSSESQVLTLEQKVSRKGEISAEICSYEIGAGKMARTALTSITMGTQICCYSFSPDQEKLLLCTIDRHVCLHDLMLQTTKFTAQIDIIPTQCSWHSDSSLVMIANERAQFQCFDLALTPIANQLQSEDVTPLNLLDLSQYFALQPTLLDIRFSCKPELSARTSHAYAQSDCFLLLLFEHGPIACMRLFAGAGMRGDIHNSGLTADVIVDKYLTLHQLEKAVSLLEALNWETYGAMCLITLHKIANYVFYRGETRRARIELLLVKALKTFSEALSTETKDEFSDQVFDLKRRFFFFLLRRNCFAEAFEIAQDIEDYDLFMDLYNLCKSDTNLIDFANGCLSQAAAILHSDERGNGNNLSLCAADFRSESACSQSTISDVATSKLGQGNALKHYVPPLPSFKSKVFSAEMLKINIPKPELRVSVADKSLERSRVSVPLHDVRQQAATVPIGAISGTLAALGLKSGSLQQRSSVLNGNALNTPTSLTVQHHLSWSQVPDQTVGIPSIPNAPTNPYVPSTSHNILPRASTTTTSTTASAAGLPSSSTLQSSSSGAYPIHYAKPAIVATEQSYKTAAAAAATTTNGNYQPRFYQHPLVSGTIPPTVPPPADEEMAKRLLSKRPTASILSNSSAAGTSNSNLTSGGAPAHLLGAEGSREGAAGGSGFGNGRSGAGEKNKVKFSDTVQVAVVPEIPRKDKPMAAKRNGYARLLPRGNLTNPKKELADSLPLCHPNDDYLKDFNPMSAEITMRPPSKSTNTKEEKSTGGSKATPAPQPSIKVVHFGVV